jgi:hypothetical protein
MTEIAIPKMYGDATSLVSCTLLTLVEVETAEPSTDSLGAGSRRVGNEVVSPDATRSMPLSVCAGAPGVALPNNAVPAGGAGSANVAEAASAAARAVGDCAGAIVAGPRAAAAVDSDALERPATRLVAVIADGALVTAVGLAGGAATVTACAGAGTRAADASAGATSANAS